MAVAVPNEGALLEWAKAQGIDGSFQEIAVTAEARQFILNELVAVGKAGKVQFSSFCYFMSQSICSSPFCCNYFMAAFQLKGFELVKGVFLEPTPFDIERDLLTPTFKKKRPQLLKFYKVRRQGFSTPFLSEQSNVNAGSFPSLSLQKEVDAIYAVLKAEEEAKAK